MTVTTGDAVVHQHRERGSLHALWVASAIGGLSQSLGGAAAALLTQQVGYSGSVAGLPQAMLVVGAALSALGLSALTRHRGRGVALSLGALTAAIGCALVILGGLSSALAWILAGSLLLGAGNTAVMLGRYAAADLGADADRARAMASVLVATTIGAVAGPNLLAPSGTLESWTGLPALTGPFLLAGAGFLATAAVFATGLGTRSPAVAPAPRPAGTALGRSGAAALAVLGIANLVMVGVMTMAPVHLHHVGASLGMIGLVVSAHIAGMFLPSPVSGRLTERFGAARVAQGSGVVLLTACGLAVAAASRPMALAVALVVLGIGRNLALVSGSVLLTAGVPAHARPRREGWREVAMGAAAASGGAASGVVATVGGYAALAAAGAAIAVLLIPLTTWLLSRWTRRPGHSAGRSRRGQPSSVAPRTAACMVNRCAGSAGS